MGKQILVPVDGSARSLDALRYAIESFPDASYTAFHVIQGGGGDLGAFAGMTGDLPDEGAAMSRSEEILEEAQILGEELEAQVKPARGRGRPDRLILDEAEEGGYDLIVIGSHGREGVSRVLLGSIAEKVVRRSPVPVLVYRPG